MSKNVIFFCKCTTFPLDFPARFAGFVNEVRRRPPCPSAMATPPSAMAADGQQPTAPAAATAPATGPAAAMTAAGGAAAATTAAVVLPTVEQLCEVHRKCCLLLRVMRARSAGGNGKSGRYKAHDTARKFVVESVVLPGLQRGRMPSAQTSECFLSCRGLSKSRDWNKPGWTLVPRQGMLIRGLNRTVRPSP